MRSTSFDTISVQDITDLAGVNRATFYDHYTDKFSLLDAMVAGGFHKMLAERNVLFDGTCPMAARAIILATCDYLMQSHHEASSCVNSAFEPLMDAGVVAAIRRTLLHGMQGKSAPEGLTTEIVATAAAWSIYGAAKQWLQTPERVPPSEIVEPILKLVFPILYSGVGGSTGEHIEESMVAQ
ncbi:TetR/AcrR family transcriptional regulator [Edaphobacter flagellatus]|uniref:TetR/AcrR family transcriptional regulator n=1 Tax=Edaphobacter flagellatus TaxID=1933044 RepID=UPI0021B1C3E7|nr:TetR/AcrR family transcriptional regulator [Edaphobacter flagellatus]